MVVTLVVGTRGVTLTRPLNVIRNRVFPKLDGVYAHMHTHPFMWMAFFIIKLRQRLGSAGF